ncbi:MAG: nucleotidyltransferase domain-containing protein [Thermoanaerobaculia bacterium]
MFGSVTRADFRPDSDIDILVTFATDARWSLWDFIDLKTELQSLLGHSVDLIEKRALKNPYRRRGILESARVIYAA